MTKRIIFNEDELRTMLAGGIVKLDMEHVSTNTKGVEHIDMEFMLDATYVKLRENNN